MSKFACPERPVNERHFIYSLILIDTITLVSLTIEISIDRREYRMLELKNNNRIKH
jgi:hypothetical protein